MMVDSTPSQDPSFPGNAYAHRALLQRNYLPARSWYRDEIPPCFTTTALTPEIASSLSDVSAINRWYDYIHYRLTRHTNSTRLLSLPHPVPYARLCSRIVDSWGKIAETVSQNTESGITPKRYGDDSIISFGAYGDDEITDEPGRLVVHNHPALQHESASQQRELAIGMRYLVRADIAAFFPSVYTHAIPWAVRGISKAKSNVRDSHYANLLDRSSRQIQRGESAGIPVGPGTSHILSELVLHPVDRRLRDKGYRFVRFIDDYHCYCESKERANGFVGALEDALARYRLNLNASKTSIARLPFARHEPWRTQLRNQLNGLDTGNVTALQGVFDMSMALQDRWPGNNVVKYATRAISRKAKSRRETRLCARHVLEVAFHFPSVIPILSDLVRRRRDVVEHSEVEMLLATQLRFRRSDTVCWLLFLWGCLGGDRALPFDLVKKILGRRDCMATATLLAIGQGTGRVKEFLENLVAGERGWEYDRFWLLIHEVGAEAPTTEEYRESTGLDGLAQAGVNFIDRSTFSTEPTEGEG